MFSEHGPNTEWSKSDDFTGFKSGRADDVRDNVKVTERKLTGGETEEDVKNIKENASLVSKVSPFSNSAQGISQSVVTFIPETQAIFTPPSLKNANLDAKDSKDVTDFGLIPDTPQGNKDEEVRSNRPLGRSFLLSTAQIGTNPIQKAKEFREAKLALKRKQSQARKGLVSVSVQFSSDENDVSSMNSINQDTSSSLNNQFDRFDCLKTENSTNGPLSKDQLLVEKDTPTKVYSDGNSLKRMCKSGFSPDSKRIISDVAKNNVDDVNNMIGCDEVAGSVKKQLCFPESGGDSNSYDWKMFENNSNGATDKNINVSTFQSAKSLLGNQSEEFIKEKKLRMERRKIKEKEQKLKQQEKILEKQRVAREENRRKSEKLMKYQLTGVTGIFFN